VILKSPVEYLLRNIRERQRDEEGGHHPAEIPEGLRRLVKALNPRYDGFVAKLRETGWYEGPVLEIDVSRIDFVSNVRHLIAVYEGIEALLVPKDFRA
jgi:deoxyadenosine/deoxycytidine kinase